MENNLNLSLYFAFHWYILRFTVYEILEHTEDWKKLAR